TLVSNSYEEAIICLHEHYKDVNETHNMLLAIEDKHQQATRIDFSRNDNPATGARSYLTRRLSSMSAGLEAWTPRSCGSSRTSR
ncbi:MAG: hypothetical protein ACKPKO_49785, partial [Candidatus Fonsibacter sp.]